VRSLYVCVRQITDVEEDDSHKLPAKHTSSAQVSTIHRFCKHLIKVVDHDLHIIDKNYSLCQRNKSTSPHILVFSLSFYQPTL
jgi:hypothetical protein